MKPQWPGPDKQMHLDCSCAQVPESRRGSRALPRLLLGELREEVRLGFVLSTYRAPHRGTRGIKVVGPRHDLLRC